MCPSTMRRPQRRTWRWRRWSTPDASSTLLARTSMDCIWNRDWSENTCPNCTAICLWRIAANAAGWPPTFLYTISLSFNNNICIYLDCEGNMWGRRQHRPLDRSRRAAFARAARTSEPVEVACCWTTFWIGNTICPTRTWTWPTHILGKKLCWTYRI